MTLLVAKLHCVSSKPYLIYENASNGFTSLNVLKLVKFPVLIYLILPKKFVLDIIYRDPTSAYYTVKNVCTK